MGYGCEPCRYGMTAEEAEYKTKKVETLMYGKLGIDCSFICSSTVLDSFVWDCKDVDGRYKNRLHLFKNLKFRKLEKVLKNSGIYDISPAPSVSGKQVGAKEPLSFLMYCRKDSIDKVIYDLSKLENSKGAKLPNLVKERDGR